MKVMKDRMESKKEEIIERDMQMDELATFWNVRTDEFGIELTAREETSCCGNGNCGCKRST